MVNYILLKKLNKFTIIHRLVCAFQHFKCLLLPHWQHPQHSPFNSSWKFQFQCQATTANQIVKNELCWRNWGLQCALIENAIATFLKQVPGHFRKRRPRNRAKIAQIESSIKFKAKSRTPFSRNGEKRMKNSSTKWVTTEMRTKETRQINPKEEATTSWMYFSPQLNVIKPRCKSSLESWPKKATVEQRINHKLMKQR